MLKVCKDILKLMQSERITEQAKKRALSLTVSTQR